MNKSIFGTGKKAAVVEPGVPAADGYNEAGGLSYTASDEEALAQLALTGTFSNTFYVKAEKQTEQVLKLAGKCSPEYVAKLAIYARHYGLMKDAPVVLLAHLFARRQADFPQNVLVGAAEPGQPTVVLNRQRILSAAFRGVVQDTKALRNFAQVIRSGAVGRKSFGTTAKKLMREFLVETKTPRDLFFGSIGDTPTLGDVVNMVHPKATTKEQHTLFRWLIGKTDREKGYYVEDFGLLNFWTEWKKAPTPDLPDAPFEMLTGEAGKDSALWKQIAKRATFNQARQTLKAFQKNRVFEGDDAPTLAIAAKLVNEEAVRKARVFPYAIMTSYRAAAEAGLPEEIRKALLVALDYSLANVPELPGWTYVFVDASGSMSSPVTGERGRVSSTVSCHEVAALYAAALCARAPETTLVIPFADTATRAVKINQASAKSYMDMYELLRNWPSGGTNCSAPMLLLLQAMKAGNGSEFPSTVIYLSDNESWIDRRGYGSGTKTASAWAAVKTLAPAAKLVCIDLQPNTGRQVPDAMADVLNIGGFSNNVFELVGRFANGDLDGARMKASVEAVTL